MRRSHDERRICCGAFIVPTGSGRYVAFGTCTGRRQQQMFSVNTLFKFSHVHTQSNKTIYTRAEVTLESKNNFRKVYWRGKYL